MYSEYPIWSVEDARAGVYHIGSMVAYSPDKVLRYIYIATEDYAGGINSPDIETGWTYLDTITDDWQSGKLYKQGNVVRFNGLLYVATRRYRDGGLPPNEELDQDGVRTWMISYEDGTTPQTPFFYRKTFGYKTLDEAYPFGNHLEDISYDTVPYWETNGIDISQSYDRFRADRRIYSTGGWKEGWQRQKEQSLINSVMEAHPYHDVYVLGYDPKLNWPYDQTQPFQWFEHAKHRSEIQDGLFPFLNTYNQFLSQDEKRNIIPKRNIPYYRGYLFSNQMTDFSVMLNGVSIEYYPETDSDSLEIINQEYFKNFHINNPKNIFSGLFPNNTIDNITPFACYWQTAQKSVTTDGHIIIDNPKISLYVYPKNICVSDIDITFHFMRTQSVCTITSTPTDDGNGGVINENTEDCLPSSIDYINKTFSYNDESRDSSAEETALFKGLPLKWVENPNYDPNCVDDQDPSTSPCPLFYTTIVDNSYPDTRIDFSSYMSGANGYSTKIQLIGYTIN